MTCPTLRGAAIALLAFVTSTFAADPILVRSPNDRIAITIHVDDQHPVYEVSYRDKPIIAESSVGLTFREGGALTGLTVLETRRDSHDKTYALIAGKSDAARDRYNEATVLLQEQAGARRRVELIFRAYDDGAAFRYRIVEQLGLKEFAIISEDSAFSLPPDAKAWVLPLPNYTSHYEYFYKPATLGDVDPKQLIGLPLLLELPNGGPAVAITEANLTEAYLKGAILWGAYLEGAVLEWAYLEGAFLEWTDLKRAQLTGAYMKGANLTGADLEGAQLKGANLTGGYLRGADLSNANLEWTTLEWTHLSGATLVGADLRGANLTGADLTGANLTGANLTGAILKGADLTGANLHKAELDGADLERAELKEAKISREQLGRAGGPAATAELPGEEIA